MADLIKDKVSSLLSFKKPFERRQGTEVQQNVVQTYGLRKSANNPFLNREGKLVNPYIDYQALLDNPNMHSATKQYIRDATGLVPTVSSDGKTNVALEVFAQWNANRKPQKLEQSTDKNEMSGYEQKPEEKDVPKETQKSSFEPLVGTRITDTSKFSNSAALGQCVWYVRGRAQEKLGVEPGSLGHAKDVWYNAPADKKVSATADNLKANMIVSYASGPGTAAQYGHVIFIEDVVGDTVYYTEGGSTYYNNGTDGVVKTATRQGILDGVNSNGSTIGTSIVGFIDMNKY